MTGMTRRSVASLRNVSRSMAADLTDPGGTPESAPPSAALRTSASKQVRAPVWQAAPTWSTLTSTVSASQSRATDLTHWKWPEVSPLTQYSWRLRDQ